MREWISVKDRLPEIQEEVIVYHFSDKINNGMCVAWIEKKGIDDKPIWQYSWCCGCYVSDPVTHWMPLLTPPKETE